MDDSFGQDWTHPTGRSASSLRTLIVDNYDSYTFNLLQLFEEDQLKNVVVIRNDQFEWCVRCSSKVTDTNVVSDQQIRC